MKVHVSRIQKQIEYLESLGLKTDPALKAASLKPEDLQNNDQMFPLETFIKIFEYAIRQSGDAFYGLHFGSTPFLAGTIGLMCASCENLKEAFINGCRFFAVQGNFAHIEFIDEADFPKIRYTLAQAWQLKDAETSRHEVEAMFSYLKQVISLNSNNTLRPYRLFFTHEAPTESMAYMELFGTMPVFGADHNEIVFREKDLRIPMKAFNKESFGILKLHLEKQISRFEQEESLSSKVKQILLSSLQYQFPDIETVSDKLRLSPRTLQRRLAQEKTTFKNLLLEAKFGLARYMLLNSPLSISEIAYSLGYSDLANFSRSFKKYEGKSPQAFRSEP